jgi:AcrR family transcriptional regulator
MDTVKNYIDTAYINVDNIKSWSYLGGFLMKQHESASSTERAYHHGDLRRSLIDAGCAMLREEQNWTFSLREVARKAGVSHNAPYNHFTDKNDLLAAVAATGFEELRERMLSSVAKIKDPKAALIKSASAYVDFGLENPARYRLMFASALTTSAQPGSTLETAATASRGVQESLQIAILAAFSLVHGLTMLVIDGPAKTVAPNIDDLPDKLARAVCHGLFRK